MLILKKQNSIYCVCPICSHRWLVVHDRMSLGKQWFEMDFKFSFNEHLKSHKYQRDIDTQCWDYTGSLNA